LKFPKKIDFPLKEFYMLFCPKEKGQGLVEYALILVMVTLVVIVVLTILGPSIGKAFSNVIETI
jgi:pilus assembly protein Flp/PilA